jgi:zinc transporter ZupT
LLGPFLILRLLGLFASSGGMLALLVHPLIPKVSRSDGNKKWLRMCLGTP